MKVIETLFQDIVIIEPDFEHMDEFEFYNQKWFDQNVSIPICGESIRFVQDNQSSSVKNVIRGMGYQVFPFTQTKLVRCLRGKIMDVVVDVRKNSPTYKMHLMIELSEDNQRQLFIPKGFAHGFLVLSENAIVSFKCDNYYNKKSERTFKWNDPTINIRWNINESNVILSENDKTSPFFNQIPIDFLYEDKLY